MTDETQILLIKPPLIHFHRRYNRDMTKLCSFKFYLPKQIFKYIQTHHGGVFHGPIEIHCDLHGPCYYKNNVMYLNTFAWITTIRLFHDCNPKLFSSFWRARPPTFDDIEKIDATFLKLNREFMAHN
jgi:hypothetical protein